MKVNPQTFQAMLMKSTTSDIILHEYINVNDVKIECQSEVILLGICINDKLKFNKHIHQISIKASCKSCIALRKH